MKNRLLKTFTSLVLTVLMVISVMPAFAITIGAAEGDTYELVTDASTLKVGDTVIIVATDSAVAMSTTQKTNNRGQATVTKSTDNTDNKSKITNIESDVQVFELKEGTKTGTFAFYTGSGYIYAASSSSNNLKTQTNNNDNGSWQIEITSAGVATIKAQGSNTRNLLKYNESSSLFSCYSSGQKDVSIYKLVKTAEETTTEGSGSGNEGVVEACNHDPASDSTTLVTIPEVPATCTTSGTTAGVRCSVCGFIDSGFEPINALGHAETPHEAQAATCTSVGWDAYVTCSRCDYTTYQEIPKIAHTYENGVCNVCGEKQPTKLTINRDSFNCTKEYAWHGWSATATTGENITGSGYIYGTTTSSIQMNSSKTGYHIYNTSALPGKIVSITLTAASGTPRDFYVLTSDTAFDQSTPDTTNATTKNVATSGATWTFTPTDRYFAIVVTGGAAYLSSIEITYKVCNHTNTVAIGEAKDATCTEDGITAGEKCANCGEVLTEQTVISATGHKDENSDGKCDICGESLCTEHNWVDGDIIKAPTCTETGIQAQYCSICKQPNPENKVLDMTEHTPETDAAIEPTCTSPGLKEGSHCSVCNKVIKEQEEVPMKDHNYVDNKCTACGDIKVQGSQLGVFQFGENGSAGHKDGSAISADTNSYKSGNYTLTLTSYTKVFGGAFDAKGNSALKLGTGSEAASLSFTVDNDVNTVVIYIAGYKADTAKIKINDTTEYTITSKSDEGDYTKVVVDTTTNKTVTLKTLSGGYRAMIDSIEFWGYAPVVKSFSLSLNEGVTVKVTFDFPEAWLNSNTGAKVVFSNGESFDAVAGTSTYSVDLTPAQINDDLTVKIQLADGSDYGATNNVSVSAYKAKVEAAYAGGKLTYTEAKYNALIDLLDAALTYSDAADGTIVEELTETFTGVDDPTVVHADENDKLFTGFAGQLGTYANIYINVNTANVQEGETLILTVGGTEIINGQIANYITKDGQIVISGLFPANFDDIINIEATKEGSMAEFTFNSYLKAIYYNSSTQQVKNLAVATYLYGLAAEAYIKAQ